MKKYILLGIISLMGLTGCTLNMNQEIACYQGIDIENDIVKEEHKRDELFVKDNALTMEFIKQLDWNNISDHTEINNIRNMININISENEDFDARIADSDYEMIKELDKKVAPGIYEFIRNGMKDSSGIKYKSTVINNVAVTVRPSRIKEIGETRIQIKMNAKEFKDARHIEIVNNISKEGFIITGPYVGENKEIIEISTPAYINKNEAIYYGENALTKTKEPNNVNYRLYISDGEISEIRMVIDKEYNAKVDKKYLQPFKDVTKLMGIGENDLLSLTEESKNSKKAGKIGEYQYTYTSVNQTSERGLENSKDTLIEVVISK